MRILSRYILRVYISNLALGLLIFTFVLLLDRLFELVDLTVNKGVGLVLMGKLLVYLLPSSLSLTLPMSNLLAALLTFGHLSETNELAAIRAGGLSNWHFMKMPVGIAFACMLFLLPFNTMMAPRAHSHFRHLYLEVLQKNPLVRIEEKTFFQIGEYHIYVEKKARRSGRLKGITIYKTPANGVPLRIFAEEGVAAVDPQQGMTLTLEDGHIEQIDPTRPQRWFYTGFKTYMLSILYQNETQTTTRSLQEMDLGELLTEIRSMRQKGLPHPLFSCELHLRFAMALTPLLFVLLGIPLAIRVQRGGRSIGLGISLVVIVGYYVLLMTGTGLGQRGIWPAWLGIWMANTVVAVVCGLLNWRLVRQ